MSDRESVTIRPRRMRWIAWILAPVVVGFSVVLGLALRGPVGESGGIFQPSDQVAMVGLGLLGAAAILLFTRPRVEADARHIKIQNIVGGYDLPWQVVRAVRFDRGSPCLTLELEDDDVVAVIAVQAADREYAVQATRTLRGLHAAIHPASPPRADHDL